MIDMVSISCFDELPPARSFHQRLCLCECELTNVAFAKMKGRKRTRRIYIDVYVRVCMRRTAMVVVVVAAAARIVVVVETVIAIEVALLSSRLKLIVDTHSVCWRQRQQQ